MSNGTAVLSLALLAALGCSQPAASRPSPSAASTAGSPAKRQLSASEPGRSPSSLDALREGRSLGTAETGPLKEIYFDFDRYDLRTDARETLKANAAWLKTNPLARVEIEGHADERGTNEYNLALGAKRAQSARDYLVTLGIEGDRLSTISYGEEIPACREPTESCWAKNRRSRFVVRSARPGS